MCQLCPVVLWALPDQMGICAIARWVSVGMEEMVFAPIRGCCEYRGLLWGGSREVGESQIMAARGREGIQK